MGIIPPSNAEATLTTAILDGNTRLCFAKDYSCFWQSSVFACETPEPACTLSAMTSHPHTPRFAVLIDGDNISADVADELFGAVARLGQASVRRLYGEFQSGRMKNWAAAAERHALLPVHVPPIGKNSTDIAMTIDAMDVLLAGGLDGICLVSSDRDFSRLAIRIREEGLTVHGFGAAHAAQSLIRACTTFGVLQVKAAAPPTAQAAIKAPAKPAPKPAAPKHPALAAAWIDAAFAAASTEWLSLSALGMAIRSRESAYLKKTGFASLKKLLTALNSRFEQGVAAKGNIAQVRRRGKTGNIQLAISSAGPSFDPSAVPPSPLRPCATG